MLFSEYLHPAHFLQGGKLTPKLNPGSIVAGFGMDGQNGQKLVGPWKYRNEMAKGTEDRAGASEG